MSIPRTTFKALPFPVLPLRPGSPLYRLQRECERWYLAYHEKCRQALVSKRIEREYCENVAGLFSRRGVDARAIIMLGPRRAR